MLRERVREMDKQTVQLAKVVRVMHTHEPKEMEHNNITSAGPEVNLRHSTGSLPKGSYYNYLDSYNSNNQPKNYSAHSPEIGVAGLSNAKVCTLLLRIRFN